MKSIIENPTVSIVIPTFNRDYTIERSVKSILNQIYSDFEIIVVDDGSTDNTKEVVERIDDNRVFYIKHEKNRGAASAINTGINHSRGKFISFIGSDDEWLPEKLQKEMKVIEESDTKIGVVYSRLLKFENNKKIYVPSDSVIKKEGNIHKEILEGNFVNAFSVIKKECFDKCGLFDENLRGFEDWELYIRISKSYEFRYLDESLAIAHRSPDNISYNYEIVTKALEMILEKHYDDFKENNALAVNYSFLGSLLCLDKKCKNGRKYFLKAIELDRFNLKYNMAYILSFSGKNYKKFLDIYIRFSN